MRVRTYGLILLGLIGIVPLALYGWLGIERSQETSIKEVREGSQHLARAVAETIRLHIEHQHELLATLGLTALKADEPEHTFATFELNDLYKHLNRMVVYKVRGKQLKRSLGSPPEGQAGLYRDLAQRVIDDPEGLLPTTVERTRYGHAMIMAQPTVIAGTVEGVIVARYDFVGVWRTLYAVRVGKNKYARLVSSHGATIAHGDPELRGASFKQGTDMVERLLAAATAATVTTNSRGQEIVVARARISNRENPDECWRPLSGSSRSGEPECWYVLIEQSVDEAFAATVVMKRDLALVGGGVLILVVVIGVLLGRALVRALERLRGHTRTLAHDLNRRIEFDSRIVEIQELGTTLDEMAQDLLTEREEAKRRTRLTTFARVAAGLAHDLRLPIEAVRGACDMVNQEQRSDPSHRFLRTISQRELPRLKRFVDDLQRLARTGTLEMEASSIQPAAMIEDIRTELARAPKWQGVEFQVDGTAEPILLDQGLVRRAILNLASNAADACLEKGQGNQVTLEVADMNDGAALEFRVIDTGVGMRPEQLLSLENGDFESTKRSTGVGLGLGVVRQVAQSHEGTLTIDSTIGEGSTFILQLPRRSPTRETRSVSAS